MVPAMATVDSCLTTLFLSVVILSFDLNLGTRSIGTADTLFCPKDVKKKNNKQNSFFIHKERVFERIEKMCIFLLKWQLIGI